MEVIGTVVVIVVVVYVVWSILTRRNTNAYIAAQDLAREYLTVYEMIKNEVADYPPERKYQFVVRTVFNKRISNEYVPDFVNYSDLELGSAILAHGIVSDANGFARKNCEPLLFRHVVATAAAADISHRERRPITQSQLTHIFYGICEVIPDHL